MTHTAILYFSYSAGILFREGMEAMLVVVALAAGTRHGRGIGRSRDVYLGAAVAIIASLLLAWAVNDFISDDASDTLEGLFQLLAAATLFYVSSWLTSKSQSDRWTGFIRRRLKGAERSAMPALALGLTAFLAVMREGAETIVFFQALAAGAAAGAERHAIAAGIAAAALALGTMFVVLERTAHKLPIGTYFKATSVLLYAMAVIFAGQGVASLQEAGRIGASFVDYAPTIPTLGIFPTLQTLGAQAILLLMAAAALFLPRAMPRRAEAEREAA